MGIGKKKYKEIGKLGVGKVKANNGNKDARYEGVEKWIIPLQHKGQQTMKHVSYMNGMQISFENLKHWPQVFVALMPFTLQSPHCWLEWYAFPWHRDRFLMKIDFDFGPNE